MEDYLVPRGVGQAEYIEKKSRFLGGVYPVTSEQEQLPKLGMGPVIPRMDKNAMFDVQLTKALIAAAREIPVQRIARAETAGDGGAIQRSGCGKRVAALYCPVAYEKAPCQMIDPKDAEQMVSALTAFLEEAAG